MFTPHFSMSGVEASLREASTIQLISKYEQSYIPAACLISKHKISQTDKKLHKIELIFPFPVEVEIKAPSITQLKLDNLKIPQELADPKLVFPRKIYLLIGTEALLGIIKGHSRSRGQIDYQISCHNTRFIVINHQTCDPHTSVHHDHSQTRKERNLRSCRRNLPLTPAHCRARVQWCMIRSGWNHADWGLIEFSDESHFQLCPGNHRRRVWRCLGQRADPAFTIAAIQALNQEL
ncbi:uncharacterized protein TNCV_4085001 [Trichonephila clavipes]|nr:uncharacterized protein TNCV_4085001 [Trichonephila clavipes]